MLNETYLDIVEGYIPKVPRTGKLHPSTGLFKQCYSCYRIVVYNGGDDGDGPVTRVFSCPMELHLLSGPLLRGFPPCQLSCITVVLHCGGHLPASMLLSVVFYVYSANPDMYFLCFPPNAQCGVCSPKIWHAI